MPWAFKRVRTPSASSRDAYGPRRRGSARPAWFPPFPYMGRDRTFSACPQDRVPRFRSRERLPARQTAPLCRLLRRSLPSICLRAAHARAALQPSFPPRALAAGSSALSAGGATSCGGATGTLSGAGTGGSVRRGVNGVFSLGMSIAMLSEAGLGSGSSNIGTTIATASSSAAAPISLSPRAHAHDIGGLDPTGGHW